MFGAALASADTSATTREVAAPQKGSFCLRPEALSEQSKGTTPAPAKTSMTSSFGVKVLEPVAGEITTERRKAATPAKIPQGDAPARYRAPRSHRPSRAGRADGPADRAARAVELSLMTRLVKALTPLVTVALVIGAEVIHSRYIGDYPVTQEPRFGWVLVLALLMLITTYAAGVTEQLIEPRSRFARAVGAVVAADMVLAIIQVLVRAPLVPLFVLGLSSLLVMTATTLLATFSERSRVHKGTQEQVVALVNIDDQDQLHKDMKGPLERPAALAEVLPAEMVTGGEEDPEPLVALVASSGATLLVLDREAQASEDIVAQAAKLHRCGVRIRTLSLFYDQWLGKLPISELERIALLFDINEIHRPVYARLKRILDISIAAPGLVALTFVTPLVALANVFGNRGSLFYHQPRVGKDGQIFTIHKFRTMSTGQTEGQWTSTDDPRLTPVGRIMRRIHVDELPQMWNVVRNDLSIVGPRPEQPQYVAKLRESIQFYDTRHLVRPGITGWAQVKYDYGSSEIDAIEKLQYEFYYLRHQSLLLDLRVLGRTLRSVVGLRGR